MSFSSRNHPSLTKFRALKRTFEMERDTWRRQATDPSAIQPAEGFPKQELSKVDLSTPTMVRMKTPDGRLWNVPGDKVDVALKRGAVRAE